jgi:hypothetical protein
VVPSSRQPFLDVAPALMAEGHDPGITIVLRHFGNTTDILKAKLGVAARLSVDEGRTTFRRWTPHPRSQDGQNPLQERRLMVPPTRRPLCAMSEDLGLCTPVLPVNLCPGLQDRQ